MATDGMLKDARLALLSSPSLRRLLPVNIATSGSNSSSSSTSSSGSWLASIIDESSNGGNEGMMESADFSWARSSPSLRRSSCMVIPMLVSVLKEMSRIAGRPLLEVCKAEETFGINGVLHVGHAILWLVGVELSCWIRGGGERS